MFPEINSPWQDDMMDGLTGRHQLSGVVVAGQPQVVAELSAGFLQGAILAPV